MLGHPVTGIGHDHFKRDATSKADSGRILHAFLPSLEAHIKTETSLAHRHCGKGLIQNNRGDVVGVTASTWDPILPTPCRLGGCAPTPAFQSYMVFLCMRKQLSHFSG